MYIGKKHENQCKLYFHVFCLKCSTNQKRDYLLEGFGAVRLGGGGAHLSSGYAGSFTAELSVNKVSGVKRLTWARGRQGGRQTENAVDRRWKKGRRARTREKENPQPPL